MKFRSLIMILSTILLTRMSVYAQNENSDYTYLKNGSMIKGRIIELVPSGSVKIRTADGSIFVYDMSQVDKLVFHSEAADLQASKSQTAQGNFSIGGSLLYERTFSDGNSTSLVNLVPSVGWFAADNVLLGLNVSYQGQTYTYSYFGAEYEVGYFSQWDWQLSIGPALEIYFGESLDKPFLNVSYLFSTSRAMPSQSLGFGLGYSIHLSRDIALQPTVNYQLLAPHGEALGQTGELTVGIGLRDFIF